VVAAADTCFVGDAAALKFCRDAEVSADRDWLRTFNDDLVSTVDFRDTFWGSERRVLVLTSAAVLALTTTAAAGGGVGVSSAASIGSDLILKAILAMADQGGKPVRVTCSARGGGRGGGASMATTRRSSNSDEVNAHVPVLVVSSRTDGPKMATE
jgi:hypothetical protein